MYVSQINETNFGNSKMLSKTPKILNRNLLQSVSKLGNLNGPYEIKKAKEIVKVYAALNAGAGALSAQAPGADELVLMGNEALMASAIVNDVYHLGFSKGFISSMLTAIMGNRVGTTTFKFASKFVTWVPFLGNAVNAGIASTTTYTLGITVIDMCEKIVKDKKNGKRIEDILKGL